MPQPSESDLEPGLRFGRFEIVRLLGRGGMGAVYLANDTMAAADVDEANATVAVKVLPPEFATNPATFKRFLAEIRAVAELSHRHVVRIHDLGQEHGVSYLVMERLADSLADEVASRGRVDWKTACRWTAEAARGLAAAHEAGLVHRDIKPDNLMLGLDGAVRVVDFGLAKGDAAGGGSAELTVAGQIVGTPAYMSPEQFEGKPLDGRTDIYSLGGTLFRMLTGELPFGGAGRTLTQIMLAHLQEPPPDVRTFTTDVPPAVADVVQGMLVKDRESRIATAAEVADRLETLTGTARESQPSGEPAAPPRTTVSLERPLRRVGLRMPSKLQRLARLRSLGDAGVADITELEPEQMLSPDAQLAVASQNGAMPKGLEWFAAVRAAGHADPALVLASDSVSPAEFAAADVAGPVFLTPPGATIEDWLPVVCSVTGLQAPGSPEPPPVFESEARRVVILQPEGESKMPASLQAICHGAEDHAEAVAALLERREPRFTGR